jgi:hypothetical protein
MMKMVGFAGGDAVVIDKEREAVALSARGWMYGLWTKQLDRFQLHSDAS